MNRSRLFSLIICFSFSFSGLIAQKTIDVIGRAETRVKPNRFEISITIREYMNGKEKQNIEALEKSLIKGLKKTGIPESELKVSSFSGNRYNWKKNDPEFLANKTYQLNIGNLGLLDKLVQNMDSKSLNNVYLKRATRDNIKEVQKNNLIKALKAARKKANYLLNSIGKSTGEVISISEVNPGIPRPLNMRANSSSVMMDYEAESITNVDPQMVRIISQILVVYEIKEP